VTAGSVCVIPPDEGIYADSNCLPGLTVYRVQSLKTKVKSNIWELAGVLAAPPTGGSPGPLTALAATYGWVIDPQIGEKRLSVIDRAAAEVHSLLAMGWALCSDLLAWQLNVSRSDLRSLPIHGNVFRLPEFPSVAVLRVSENASVVNIMHLLSRIEDSFLEADIASGFNLDQEWVELVDNIRPADDCMSDACVDICIPQPRIICLAVPNSGPTRMRNFIQPEGAHLKYQMLDGSANLLKTVTIPKESEYDDELNLWAVSTRAELIIAACSGRLAANLIVFDPHRNL
jgi:hypothetical protein